MKSDPSATNQAANVHRLNASKVDEIQAWHFDGQIPTGPAVQIDTPHTADTWSGRVILSGIVSVDVLIDDSLHTFQDSLIVRPRDLSDSLWAWDDGKWDYDPGGGKPCFDYAPYYYPAADTIPLAENSSAEDCAIQTFTPQSNDIDLFHLTYAADSIWNGGPNNGLHFVKRAYYEMKHGSYYNPSARPDTAGSAVTSGDNLKDCRARKNVTSLSKNLHEYNLDCTKPPERNEFLAWWAAVENHEGYGTPGAGPANNGHQAQREIAAAIPANDPYRLAEPAVGQTSFQLKALLGTPVFGADMLIGRIRLRPSMYAPMYARRETEMSKRVVGRLVSLTLTWTAFMGMLPVELNAQQMSASESVLCFESQRRAYPQRLDVSCPEGVVPAPGVLLEADTYPPAFVESVLDELVRLSLTTDSDIVRRDAVQWIAFLGRIDTGLEGRRSGFVDRLSRVYDEAPAGLSESSTRIARRVAIHMMGKQADTEGAAAFLERVARQPARPGTAEPMPVLAIKTLHEMGPAGQASLDRLRREREPRQDMPDG